MTLPPCIARVRIERRGKRPVRLWVPLFLVWPVVALLGLFLAPFVLVASLIYWRTWGRSVLRAGPAIVALLCASRGTRVHLRQAANLIHVELS